MPRGIQTAPQSRNIVEHRGRCVHLHRHHSFDAASAIGGKMGLDLRQVNRRVIAKI